MPCGYILKIRFIIALFMIAIRADSSHSQSIHELIKKTQIAIPFTDTMANPVQRGNPTPAAKQSRWWRQHATIAPASETTPYLAAVIGFIETMIQHGTDRYGPEHSPMFASILDIETQSLPLLQPELLPGQRSADRAYPGGNMQQDLLTLLTMYYVSDYVNRADYADAADAYLAFFLDHCAPVGNGLFPSGEHAFWNFYEETVEKPKHEELGLIPDAFLDRLWSINPTSTEQHIRSLLYHIVDEDRWYWNRHAPILGEHDDSIRAIPRHGGFYIYQWSYLYKQIKQEEVLDWAKKTAEVHWHQRHPITGLTPYFVEGDPIRSDDPDKAEVVTSQILALGVALLQANALLGHDALARFEEVGRTYVHSAIDTVSHDPKHGIIIRRLYADGSPYAGDAPDRYRFWDSWYAASGGYGFQGAEKFAIQVLNAYRLLGSPAYLTFAQDIWHYYQTIPDPSHDDIIVPGKLAGLIALSLDLFDLTGETMYLAYALKMCDWALDQLYVNGLFRAAVGKNYYEAANGVGALVMELFRFHLTVTGSAYPLPRNYWDY